MAKVLIVDDEKTLCNIMALNFSDAGLGKPRVFIIPPGVLKKSGRRCPYAASRLGMTRIPVIPRPRMGRRESPNSGLGLFQHAPPDIERYFRAG